MKKRKNRRKVFIIMVLSLSLCMGLFSSYALSTDDASVILSTNRPNSVMAWLCRAKSSAFSFVKQSSPTLQFPSIMRFMSQANFDYTNSFGSTQNVTLTYFEWNQMFEYQSGYVYQISLNFSLSPSQSDYIDSADMSKFLFVLPVGNVPASDFTFSNYSTYFYNGFAPSSVSKSSTSVVLTYTIPIYPDTTFSRSIPTNGVYEMTGFALMDYGTGLVHSTQSPDGTFWRYSQILAVTSLDCSVYTQGQYQTLAVQDKIDGLSNQIDNLTDHVDQAAQDIINAGDPIDDSGLYSAHQSEDQLINAIYSTSAYTPVVGTTIATGMGNFVAAAKPAVSNWLQYVFQTNGFANLIVWGAYFSICIFLAMKAVF